jgi:aspartate dehydrogenase
MLKIGLIGYGTIARAVIQNFNDAGRSDSLVGVLVRPGSAADNNGACIPLFEHLTDLLEQGPAIIAETAGQDAVIEHGAAVLEAGCDFLITSVGALADDDVMQRLRATAQQAGRRIFLPAGAMGGIDAIAAMGMAGLNRVTYRSRKPPRAWQGSEAEKRLDLAALAHPETFFQGTAREAAQRFPKNANVAATVALAGLGLDRTEVELVADPTVADNIHEVEADGVSGRVSFRLEGRAFPDNPRSSMLTAYSVARTLLNIDAPLPI